MELITDSKKDMVCRVPVGNVRLQRHAGPKVLAVTNRVFDRFRETLDIPLSLVESLASEGMNGMGCITNQCYSLSNICVGVSQLERE